MLSKISEIIKNIFSFDWLKGGVSETAAGTVIGHSLGNIFSEIIGNITKEGTKIILQQIFYIPPRGELVNFLRSLPDDVRIFYQDRLKEAKEKTDTPSENDTVTALCKPLALRKDKILLQTKDGKPILRKGKPIFLVKPGLSDNELRQFYIDLAKDGPERFWIWVDAMIHDKWAQKFEVAVQKIQEGMDVFLEWWKNEVWAELKSWWRETEKEAKKLNTSFKRKMTKKRKEREARRIKKSKWLPW